MMSQEPCYCAQWCTYPSNQAIWRAQAKHLMDPLPIYVVMFSLEAIGYAQNYTQYRYGILVPGRHQVADGIQCNSCVSQDFDPQVGLTSL